ncbi:hypothetical protein BC936DRAFT_149031 [Jimgerdemannia flammicorona]|uniref:Uncharacterized protein n=1 Tax=Jimgerdemannia flammicorona TaxID=994334 RepID=A0A433D1R9_9FUNG|nr:hypothetical protein BC936DRAFT_149031 [Jimgerdemannia flammicorona]
MFAKLHVDQFKSYVVGDLSKADAEIFFRHHILADSSMTSGNNYIERVQHFWTAILNSFTTFPEFVDECAAENRFFKPEYSRFRALSSRFLVDPKEYSRFQALTTNRHLVNPPAFNPPAFNESDLLVAMEMFVMAHQRGFILGSGLVREIGEEATGSLVENQVAFRRPTNKFVYDLVDPPPMGVLTPREPPRVARYGLYASSSIVKNIQKRRPPLQTQCF